MSNNASWGNGDTGLNTGWGDLPSAGRKCVNAVLVGCYPIDDASSARTIDSAGAVSNGIDYDNGIYNLPYAGRFSIPHLQL